MTDLRSHRGVLGISQSKLARLSGVSRFNICQFELGAGKLTSAEQQLIRQALQREAARLRNITLTFDPEPALAATVAPAVI